MYNKEANDARIARESEKRMSEYQSAKEKRERMKPAKPVLTAAQQEEQERQRKAAIEQAKVEAGKSMRRFL